MAKIIRVHAMCMGYNLQKRSFIKGLTLGIPRFANKIEYMNPLNKKNMLALKKGPFIILSKKVPFA
jgi:hypothetical protein